MAIDRQKFDLATVFSYAVPYSPYGLIVEKFTGLPDTCYISRGSTGKPIATVQLGRKLDYGEPLVDLYIHNTLAQSASELIITFATKNAVGSLTLPTRQNPAVIVSEVLAVGNVTAVNFGVHIIPLEIEGLVTASATNTADIYVGGAGVTAATGFVLAPGDSIYFKVRDTSVIYLIAAALAQEARLVVEAEA